MRESEHFNLFLAEGSDIVNPLVQDVQNYEKIDAQMFKNQNAGVQNATELKNGTVHAITRNVPDAQFITFTATSNYTAGETFTVDGVQVTALTVSGETLATGAYVINSQVLCVLKGTLLTVYGVGSKVADNSLALNGHPDTYFGTKEEVDNAINTANAANVLVEEINNSLTVLGSEFIIGAYINSNNKNIVYKRNNIVYINVDFIRNNYALPTDTTIATLKEKFRPTYDINFIPCCLRSTVSGYTEMGWTSIDTEGNMKIGYSGFSNKDTVLLNEIILSTSFTLYN